MAKVMVIGKEHREGISKKTGKPYSINVAYYTGEKPGVNGVVGFDTVIGLDLCSYENIQIGKYYLLEFDNRGFVLSFKPVQ